MKPGNAETDWRGKKLYCKPASWKMENFVPEDSRCSGGYRHKAFMGACGEAYQVGTRVVTVFWWPDFLLHCL
jgi:hypothetical protein